MKAVFLDYTGTMVSEEGEYTKALIAFFMKNSDIGDPREAVRLVWKLIRKYELESYKENFLTEEQIVDKIIEYCAEKHSLRGDLDYLRETWKKSWVYAPLYDDVKPFFERCRLPIIVITNDGEKYIKEAMRVKGLSPAGIVSAESVRAYKPHREIFEKALEVSGFAAEDAVHIGDSVESDIKGANSAGIKAILVNRAGADLSELGENAAVNSLDEINFD